MTTGLAFIVSGGDMGPFQVDTFMPMWSASLPLPAETSRDIPVTRAEGLDSEGGHCGAKTLQPR